MALWMPRGHPDAHLKVYCRVCTNYSNKHPKELSRAVVLNLPNAVTL